MNLDCLKDWEKNNLRVNLIFEVLGKMPKYRYYILSILVFFEEERTYKSVTTSLVER